MSRPNQKSPGHSANVQIQLSLNGHVFGVAQLGPAYLILKNPIDHPPAEAELTIQIDGHEKVRHLWLPEGLKAGQRKTAISRCPENKGSTDR